MAAFADSEATLWRQADHIRRLQQQYLHLQQILAVLASRQGGVLVIDPAEFMTMPPGAVLVSAERPDGCMVLRVETGERPGGQGDGAEPGSEG